MTVIEFDYMKAAAVDIEMDVANFKIRRDGLPNLDFGVELFYFTPRSISDALAVYLRRNEKQLQIARVPSTLITTPVLHYPVCFAAVNGMFNSFAGYDLAVIFKMIVAAPEFFKRTVIECLLIIVYELLPIIRSQWNKYYFCHGRLIYSYS